jgi:hypothetical protein
MTINSICSSISSAFSYAGHSISSAVSSALRTARALVQSLWNRVFPKTENQVPAASLAGRVETLSGGAVEANHVSATEEAHASDALDQTPAVRVNPTLDTGATTTANPVRELAQPAPSMNKRPVFKKADELFTGRVGRVSSRPKPAATPATKVDTTSLTQFPPLGAVRR